MKKLILCKRLFTAETDAVLEDMAILLEDNLIAGYFRRARRAAAGNMTRS